MDPGNAKTPTNEPHSTFSLMDDTYLLAGKSIWITGGAGHLGAPITIALDARCARVLCFDIQGRAEALVDEYKLRRTIGVNHDMCDTGSLSQLVEAMISAHGVPDGIAHLAFASSSGKRLTELTPGEFQQTLDRATTSTFVLCRALAERMLSRRSGSVVLFSSMYGMVAPDPRIYHESLTPNPIDYGASKAALQQLARYFAAHYGSAGLRFNCVTPGPFPNRGVQKSNPSFLAELARRTMLNRHGDSGEIVGPTLFLLSEASSYVTGHSLVVDGGWTAW